MKNILYAGILGAGLMAASPARALDVSEGPTEKEIHNANLRPSLEHLLGTTLECSSVSISQSGMLQCRYEKFVGGCNSDRTISYQIHEYDLHKVRKVNVKGNKVTVAVPGESVKYTFPNSVDANEGARLLEQYRKSPQVRTEMKPLPIQPGNVF